MHQLKVFRCKVCQTPFLFESSLEDHIKEHAQKDAAPKPAAKKRSRSKK